MNLQTNTELGNDPVPQLSDLSRDPGERQNLADAHSDKVKEMQARLDVLRGRPGGRRGGLSQVSTKANREND
jgi:hypothetical protein